MGADTGTDNVDKEAFSVSTFVFVSKALEMTILTKRLGLL